MAIPSARSPFGAGSLVGICALLSLLLFCEPAAIAATIIFNDLSETPSITFSGPDAARASGSCQGEVCTVTLLPPPPGLGSTTFQQRLNILDNEGISDILTVDPTTDPNFNVLFFTIVFTSDSGVPLVGGPSNVLRENGMLQTASSISWFLSTGTVTDTIQFQSDLNETPEASGASLVLIGLALIAAGHTFRSIRRRRAATNALDGLV